MYRPKITIITAVYNRADKIEQCISSVVNQTYDSLEYIIIDGGSTDGTVDVIKKYADKIAYWCSEPDKGIYDAWNKGLKHVTGDYVLFMGSDDALYDYHTISNVVSELDGDVDVLSGCFYTVLEKEKMDIYSTNEYMLNKKSFPGYGIPTQGLFIKNCLFHENEFDISYKIAADFKFTVRIYYDSNVKFKYIAQPIQFFEDGGISSTQVTECHNEYERIYQELGLLQFVKDNRKKCVKTKVINLAKDFLKFLGIFDSIKRYYHLSLKGDWKKHHCNNKICRWCGRYEL